MDFYNTFGFSMCFKVVEQWDKKKFADLKDKGNDNNLPRLDCIQVLSSPGVNLKILFFCPSRPLPKFSICMLHWPGQLVTWSSDIVQGRDLSRPRMTSKDFFSIGFSPTGDRKVLFILFDKFFEAKFTCVVWWYRWRWLHTCLSCGGGGGREGRCSNSYCGLFEVYSDTCIKFSRNPQLAIQHPKL